MSRFWQYDHPLRCPKGHVMGWLGSVYWICGKRKCQTIYVQTEAIRRARLKADGSLEIQPAGTGR